MPSRPSSTPLLHGLFLVATGAWPVVHLDSFEAVTGPKADGWLVKSTGGLLATIGAALVASAFERRRPRSARLLGVGTALTLGTADVVYAGKGRISPIYLADAVVQALFIKGWMAQRRGRRALPRSR